jgi:hypothetical protein
MTDATYFEEEPIWRGDVDTLNLYWVPAVLTEFPTLMAGRVLAHFKLNPTDPFPTATIDTAAVPASVTRSVVADPGGELDGYALMQINLTSAQTTLFTKDIVYFDVIVYDGVTPRRLPGEFEWPVMLPITRP